MTKRVALSPNDSLWLNMDTAENLMIIESVMWFDEPLELDAVLDTLRERLIGRYPVFTWRPERPESGVGQDHWVADPAFRLEDHVHVHDVGAAAGPEAIQAFMGERMSEPLPTGKPLWQAYILNGEDVSAIVMRFHHAIADGTALVRVLLDMTTDTPYGDSSDAAPAEFDVQLGVAAEAAESAESRTRTDLSYAPENPPVDNVPVPSDRQQVGTLDRTVGVLSNLVTWPLHLGAKATSSAAGLVQQLDPETEGGIASRLAGQARGTADLVDTLLVGTGTHLDSLPFGRPGIEKSADWAPPYPLDQVKQVARTFGGTVNDVMMAALAGALRRYVVGRGELPRDVTTMIPVNLRPWDAPLPEHLGNKFALVAFELPASAPTPQARLAVSKERMDVIKAGPEAILTFGLAHAIGTVGTVTSTLSRQLTAFFGNKAFGVTTNVPGPTTRRYFAGREMVGVLGWVPGASHQTLGACIFSYNGNVRVGFKADTAVIPDVANLVAAFDDEMADLFAESAEQAAAAAQATTPAT